MKTALNYIMGGFAAPLDCFDAMQPVKLNKYERVKLLTEQQIITKTVNDVRANWVAIDGVMKIEFAKVKRLDK